MANGNGTKRKPPAAGGSAFPGIDRWLAPRPGTVIKKTPGNIAPSARGGTGLDGAPIPKRKPGTLRATQMDTGKMNTSQLRGYKQNMPNLISPGVTRSTGLPKPKRVRRTRKKNGVSA